MKNQNNRLDEDTAHEILELAARYYTEQANKEQNQGYTVSELIDAGTEAAIPDEYIQQAVKEIKIRKKRPKKRKQKDKKPGKTNFISNNSVIGFSAIAIVLGSFVLFKDNIPNSITGSLDNVAKEQTINLNPQSKVKLTVLGDTFSGYSTLRNLKFQNALREKDIQLSYNNEFDQKVRAEAINKGEANLIVTTLDRYLINKPQGKIVGLIDRTVGADAIVFNNRAYPQLKSLLNLESLIQQQASKGKWLKIVFAGDTPSEFLATVLDTKFDNFKLSNLEIVEVEDASIAWEMMQQDSDIALAVLWEPFVSQAKSQGNKIALSSSDAPTTIVDIIVASDRILENNPEAVTEFVSAYYQSIDSSLQDSSLLTHQIAIDGKMNAREAQTVSKGIKFFSSLEAQTWMKSGELQQRIEAIAAILTLAGKIDEIPLDSQNLFTAEYLTPAVERTNNLIKAIGVDHPELAQKLQGVSTKNKASISNAKIAKAEPIGNLTVQGEVKFQTGSAQLTPESQATIAKLRTEISEFNPDNIAIKVQGHTSKTGDAGVNQRLSQQRAEIVAKQLKQNNLPHSIVSEGLGFSQLLPEVDPTSPLNQRTVIRLVRIGS